MFNVDPKKVYLKEEFCNITIFPNHETGRFVAKKLHASSSYEVCGDSQEDASAQTTGSSQGPTKYTIWFIYKLPIYTRPTFEMTTTTSIFFKREGDSQNNWSSVFKDNKGKINIRNRYASYCLHCQQ